MRNRIFIGSLIVTLLAFALYSFNLKQAQRAHLQIVQESGKGKVKREKEPKIKEQAAGYAAKSGNSEAKTAAGSQKHLAAIIKKSAGQDYQVKAEDLNRPAVFADVKTESGSTASASLMRLYVLAGLYQKERRGQVGPSSSVKIKKSDVAGRSKGLQSGMAYGYAFLRQAMMRGSRTAENALVRKIGVSRLNSVARVLGAKNTRFYAHYQKGGLGQTTAADLAGAVSALSRGKVVGPRYGQLLIGSLQQTRHGLAAIPGGGSGLHGGRLQLVVVRSGSRPYVLAAKTGSMRQAAKLGKSVYRFFAGK